MSQTHTSIYIHCMFSTKNHANHISPKIEKRIWRYIGGIAERMGVNLVAIGGTDDHVHLLLKLPPDLSLSFVMQKLKGISSKWINDTFYPQHRFFRWQAGYLAFSIGYSHVEKLTSFIQTQRQWHETISTEDEFRLFMEKYDIALKRAKPPKPKKAAAP
jgi:putative transposase